jgi:phosphocarrier protein
MIKQKLIVQNTLGIHARPAGDIANIAFPAQSSVEMVHRGERVNAKSILNLMMLAVSPGSEVEFLINGPDEQKVADELTKFFNNKFNEDAS